MNWNMIEGNWTQLKGKVRSKWGKLTDNDLTTLRGKKDELSGLLQKRYGIMKDEAERQLDEWAEGIDVREPLRPQPPRH